MKEALILWTIIGILFRISTAQVLITKCPSNDWTKFKERCYLTVGFSHSWSRANAYCQKYGAKLVEPAGYVINDEISNLVSAALPDSTSIWTGFSQPDNLQPDYMGEWSNEEATSVHVGPWGHNEPNRMAGQCAFISMDDRKWYMSDCGRVRNFVCEMDPCPAANRNTFMCNGKCLGSAVLCNGIDDCGNNQDEQDCANVEGGDCTIEYEGSSGQITPSSTNAGLYEPNTTCSWTLKTSPGKRIVLNFRQFQTEEDNDFVEIFDGGLTSTTSELAARLSGTVPDYTFISSYNFLTVRFVSDASTEFTAFQATWSTNLDCGYSQIDGYTYSNADIMYERIELASLQTTDKCVTECDKVTSCVGFRYDTSARECFLLNRLPVLQMKSGSQLWIQKCYGDTTVQGAVPMLPTQNVATLSPKQLATPLYPYPYVGNMEAEYTITAPANNLITLEVLSLELCCEDSIYIYDKDYDLLETLTSGSTTRTIISTSNTVHIKMELTKHWKCHGALIEYRQGCDVTMVGSGTLSSPGYGTDKKYPDLMDCSWSLHAPSPDRSVTLRFDYFGLEQLDNVKIIYSDGTQTTYTGTSLNGQSFNALSYINMTISTSSLGNAPGFLASFSPGCPVLRAAEGYVLSPNTSVFGSKANLSCAEGYTFGSAYIQQIPLTCETGGHWSVDIPTCTRGKCGPAPQIANGYVNSSQGSLGGDVTVYACKTGFTLVGRPSIQCLTNNSWDQPPSCVSTLCQDILFAAPVTESDVVLGDGFNYGSVANLTCSIKDEIIGAPIVRCQSGDWDFVPGISPSYCNPIPCAVPVIEHAVLSPQPEYVQRQQINITCVEGYDLEGNSSYICGEGDPLPQCIIQNCTLDEFSLVVPVGGSSQTEYVYGESVNVTCEDSYYLQNVSTTQMTITCQATNNWSHSPTCAKKSCGEPYIVAGSAYTPNPESEDFCFEHGCSFTFQCRKRYVLDGESSFGDTEVRCGNVTDGLWDFGDLRCYDGQCPDPVHPASGKLHGDSFEEGSTVTFTCDESGYSPLESSGMVSQGMTCQYNSTSEKMEWVGEMPECKDTEAPVIHNCGSGSVLYTAEMLKPLSPLTAPQPYATDNTGIKEWRNYEETWLSHPFAEAKTLTYRAIDFNDNSAICVVRVVIPDSVDCRNDLSTNYELTEDTSIPVSSSVYVNKKSAGARYEFVPEVVDVLAEADTLNTIYEVQATSFQWNSSVVLDTCTIQFRFHAPACVDWAFEIPNGAKTCSSGYCDVTCDEGSFFMEDPERDVINMTCVDSDWDREPPVCAQSTEGYVIYTAMYEYKYFVIQGVSDKDACEAAYRPQIENNLRTFASDMQTECSTLSNNPPTVTLLDTFISFSLASKRDPPINLTVRFEFQLITQNESLSNAAQAKDSCASLISSRLNTQISIGSISSLNHVINDSLTCNNGTYDLTSTQPVFEYKCQGRRRFVNKQGQRLCLFCPVGYEYDAAAKVCSRCPAGTYGVDTDDGPKCETCPNGRNPGLLGQTDASSCDFKGACPAGYYSFDGLEPCDPCPKNYYSPLPYSRTCTPCEGHMVTYKTNSTSSSDCKTLEDAINDNAVTPCTPSPCWNGGNCSFYRLDYHCTCPPGFTGRKCESTYNGCTSKPCHFKKQCIPDPDGFSFTCICGTSQTTPNELSGQFCESDDFGCAHSYCKNNGTCHNQFQSYSCKCPSYSGYENAEDSDLDGVCGVKINPCGPERNPCQHGTCYNHGHFYSTCDCDPGWTGIKCDTSIDDCDLNICENGATCVDGVNSFTCSCPFGFHGAYCQFRRACDKQCGGPDDTFCNTCNVNNTKSCVNIVNDFECDCKTDFTGRSCEIDSTVCKSYPCQHGGTCTAIDSVSFSCACTEPWTGDLCDELPNNCPNGQQCYNGGTCYSTYSGYQCSCPENYFGDSCAFSYNHCERVNPCAGPGSTCSYENGEFSCSCQTGYSGDYCENSLQSCSDNICQNGAQCLDTSNGAVCSCAEGFTGETCDTDIDDCLSDPCSANQECIDGLGGYTCVCTAGTRGQNCNKREDFDYVITPKRFCREEASIGVFGDGKADINKLSLSFWSRYKGIHGDSAILNVFGSKSGGTLIPESPDFQMTFYSGELRAFYDDTSSSRRKRETKVLEYDNANVNVIDGHWHIFDVTWSASSGEMTLYIDGQLADQEVFSRDNAVANVGFLVFGEFDPVTGTSVPESSFEGRINRLYVVNGTFTTSQIQQLYTRSYRPPNIVLYQERTIMQLYSVDYNSELELNEESCLPTDSNCKKYTDRTTTPSATSCPSDTLAVIERGQSPNWTEPVFSGGAIAAISNVGGSNFEYGVHGISYASLDGQGDAAMCSFRLYVNDVGCGSVDGNDATCTSGGQGITRCTDDCSEGELLPGDLPLYLTCSLYGMWDEAVKYTDFIYPECSATTDGTQRVTVNLTAVTSTGHCNSSIIDNYRAAVIAKFNDLNGQQPDNELCTSGCSSTLASAFTCDGNNVDVSIDFGILSPTMIFGGESVTTEELFKIAVGDFQAFHYTDASNMTISPVLSTFDATVTPECAAGYMVSSGKCVLCGKGTFYDSSTKTCKRCEIGSYRSDLTDPVSECTQCHQSLTTPAEGARDIGYCITRCLLGYYYKFPNIPSQPNFPINGGTCTVCPVGSYQDELGQVSCKQCPVGLTTAGTGTTAASDCDTPGSFTTTTVAQGTPAVGAATEAGGLSVGVIVAIVLGVLLGLTIIILIVCFCCCKELLPCMAKKKQVVSPAVKDGYYARKYGEHNMQFVSYNLQDIREKKGKPLDRVPFVEPPLSDETGSVKTDISVHVPVFTEKMDGKIKRKSLYMTNGVHNLSASLSRSGRTPRDPVMTSSPRETHYHNEMEADAYVKPKQKRRRKKQRKDRASSEGRDAHRYDDEDIDYTRRSRRYHDDEDEGHVRRSRRHYDDEDEGHVRRSRRHHEDENEAHINVHVRGPLPKALSPMPHRLVSKPPDDVILRPSSALEQPRVQVIPSQYEDFLDQSPSRDQEYHQHSSRSRDKKSSKSRRRPKSYDDAIEEPKHQYSGDYYEEQTPFHIKRIEVESDEDLR